MWSTALALCFPSMHPAMGGRKEPEGQILHSLLEKERGGVHRLSEAGTPSQLRGNHKHQLSASDEAKGAAWHSLRLVWLNSTGAVCICFLRHILTMASEELVRMRLMCTTAW